VRAALAIVALAGCPAPRTGGPPGGGHDPAPSSGPGAGEHPGDGSTDTGGHGQPGGPAGEGSTGDASPQPPGSGFVLDGSRRDAWVVAAGSCVALRIRPHDASAGALLLRGVRIDYEQRAGTLVLGPASRSEGEGIATRTCHTTLRMGPGATLGGATVFDDEDACLAGRTSAAALDDSPEAIAARCTTDPLAVSTDEAACVVDERAPRAAAQPGCLGVALDWPHGPRR
jgi:hypothetical protein